MLFLFFFVFVLFLPSNTIDSHCRENQLCRLNNEQMTVTCDTMFGRHNESHLSSILSCFPPANTYSFRNFQQIQSYTFQNLTLPENQSVVIQLVNISTINSDIFSKSINLPESSNLSIDIDYSNHRSKITLKSNIFNHIRIDNLRFFNLNNFNGRPIFDTNCFGNNLQINQLIFEQCNITGFSNNIRKTINVDYLSIINSPSLTQLTNINLPLFLPETKSLEISNTGLEIINKNTFIGWSINKLEELIISNNSNLENFPLNIVDGVLQNLNKLDLSYNPIKILDKNYDWFAFSNTKELLLKNQQLDLFLKTNILQTLPNLEIIDLSEGFIRENNDDLIKNYFPSLSKLISIDVSYINLTENMIIDLLSSISQTTDHFIDIYLHGHSLNDKNFCSYFTIFKNAPNLLNLRLDDTHECNCVIDLFYMNKLLQDINNNSILEPTCLLNSTRTPCNIETKSSTLKCQENTDGSNPNDNIGNYAFGAIVAGLTVLVVVLLSLGATVVYQIRRRRNTELFMEQPIEIENPLDAVIEERLQNS